MLWEDGCGERVSVKFLVKQMTQKEEVTMSTVTYLPALTSESWQWQHDAACKDMGTQRFFHPSGERGASRRRRAALAKEICAHCPVLEECRDYALRAREPYGVWGGMTEEERFAYWKGNEVKTA